MIDARFLRYLIAICLLFQCLMSRLLRLLTLFVLPFLDNTIFTSVAFCCASFLMSPNDDLKIFKDKNSELQLDIRMPINDCKPSEPLPVLSSRLLFNKFIYILDGGRTKKAYGFPFSNDSFLNCILQFGYCI